MTVTPTDSTYTMVLHVIMIPVHIKYNYMSYFKLMSKNSSFKNSLKINYRKKLDVLVVAMFYGFEFSFH